MIPQNWASDSLFVYQSRPGFKLGIVGAATALFQPPLLSGPTAGIGFTHQFDVAAEGRFLGNVPVEPVNDQSITVVINWTAGVTW